MHEYTEIYDKNAHLPSGRDGAAARAAVVSNTGHVQPLKIFHPLEFFLRKLKRTSYCISLAKRLRSIFKSL